MLRSPGVANGNIVATSHESNYCFWQPGAEFPSSQPSLSASKNEPQDRRHNYWMCVLREVVQCSVHRLHVEDHMAGETDY